MDGGSRGGRAKRQRSNSGAGKGVKAVLAMGSKGGWFHNPDPARRHPGRPTAANAAGGGESLRPLCLVRPGRGFHVGRKARHAAGIPCPTSRQHGYQYHPDLEPGKFPRGGPAQGHPHPFRCAGMGVGCAAGGPLRRFDPGGPQTGEPQIRERSTYRWRFPGKCLRPPTSGGTDRRSPWTTNPPGWTGCWCWPQRRP